MIKELKDKIISEILPKYSSFCNNIDLEFGRSHTNSKFIHFKPTLCIKALSGNPEPKEFMDLKCEIYSVIEKHTNKKPILIDEWKLKSKHES